MRFLVLALALLSCGCVVGPVATAPLTVSEVHANARELIGREITVTGQLTRCLPRGCAITEGEDGLGIGASPEFDKSVATLGGQKVIIRAVFTGRCFDFEDDDIISVCMDRGDALADPILLGTAD